MRMLETPRLLLLPLNEPLAQDDWEAAYRMYVTELDGAGLSRTAFDDELQFDLRLAHNALGQDFGRPAIHHKADHRRIGHASFLPRRCSSEELTSVLGSTECAPWATIEVELGWAISDRYRNRGYATEAAQALVDYAFGELGLARLVAFTEPSNRASLRVMQKLGMRVGPIRENNELIGVLSNTRTSHPEVW